MVFHDSTFLILVEAIPPIYGLPAWGLSVHGLRWDGSARKSGRFRLM